MNVASESCMHNYDYTTTAAYREKERESLFDKKYDKCEQMLKRGQTENCAAFFFSSKRKIKGRLIILHL